MPRLVTDYRPARKLVPVLTPLESVCPLEVTLKLAKAFAARGESVLMIDARDGALLQHAGIIYARTLGDVLYRRANIADAKYITSNEHFTACAAGDANLSALLGSIAALSLAYDWTFIAAESGCTPAHVGLAAAADDSIMMMGTQSDDFMRSYWMIDAVRARQPKFDPIMVADGQDGEEVFGLLSGTVQNFLGAAPHYGGAVTDDNLAARLAARLSRPAPNRSAQQG